MAGGDARTAFLMRATAAALAGGDATPDQCAALHAAAKRLTVETAGEPGADPRWPILRDLALAFCADALRADLAAAMRPLLDTLTALNAHDARMKREGWRGHADMGGAA